MSISKEIFGLNYKANGYAEAKLVEEKESIAYRWPQEMIDGYNQALDDVNEHELSEEELAKIMYKHIGCVESHTIAKAIKENQSKIFVRKNEKTP